MGIEIFRQLLYNIFETLRITGHSFLGKVESVPGGIWFQLSLGGFPSEHYLIEVLGV
jgi:hypothetical protein